MKVLKRKRFDRDIWNFGGFPYYQMRIDTDEFHGLICLLKLLNGNKNVEYDPDGVAVLNILAYVNEKIKNGQKQFKCIV